METNCYNCGAAVDERSAFCPSCGTAQIRVSPREQSSDAAEQPGNRMEGTAVTISGARPPLSQRSGYPAGLNPDLTPTIRWGQYFKSAWPLALVAGIATGLFPPGGFLLFLPIAVIVSLRLYRKHHLGPIRTGQGALMGAALSVLSFVAVAAIFALYFSSNSAQFRDAMLNALNDAAARNPNPEGMQALRNLVDSPEGVLTLFCVLTFVLFCFNMISACLTGAVAASFGRDKQRL